MVPFYHRPSLPVPTRFAYDKSATPSAKDFAYDIGWHEFFKDPRLQKLIELALNNNRDYRVALLNVEQLRPNIESLNMPCCRLLNLMVRACVSGIAYEQSIY